MLISASWIYKTMGIFPLCIFQISNITFYGGLKKKKKTLKTVFTKDLFIYLFFQP